MTIKQGTKQALLRRLNREYGIPFERGRELVDVVIDSIIATCLEHGECLISNFGEFYLKERKGGAVAHVDTGEMMEYPDRKRIHFRMSKTLREKINKGEFNGLYTAAEKADFYRRFTVQRYR
jgi:nucleoid DNA-binding protein